MNSMVRERDTHVSRLFIEVTPGIRRALELLAEASITLLDEIDAPVDEHEADPDFEYFAEDDEDGHDEEDEADEPDLGWTIDGRVTHGGDDDDIVAPETSSGLIKFEFGLGGDRAAHCSLFDPRLDRRGASNRTTFENEFGRFSRGKIPAWPQDLPNRPVFFIEEELRRLRRELVTQPQKRRKKA